MAETVRTDAMIVGAGIAGLWTAKDLAEQGLDVTLVDHSPTLADGQTTRNEGWLHAGTYHSVAVEDAVSAAQITQRTVYGHRAIAEFAPESIDHPKSFALVKDPALATKAILRWEEFDIPYGEVDRAKLEPSVASNEASATFAVSDMSVHTVKLCRRLARSIMEKGGRIITGANFKPLDDTTAELRYPNGNSLSVHARHFILAAGAGNSKLVEAVTGTALPTRYFQAHLLVAPRLTQDNYFYLDVGEAGVMSHGGVSIVGINRDGITLDEPSYDVVPEKEQLVREALHRMVPHAAHLVGRTAAVACCKPDIYRDPTDTQNLNVQVLPFGNYTCIYPGKMTEAPYLANEVTEYVMGKLPGNTPLRVRSATSAFFLPQVTLRPADRLVS